MDGRSSFKNLIPILKDKNMLFMLYSLEDQISLERFLKEKDIVLSLEEIEKLWDIIEICKPYYSNEQSGDKQFHGRKKMAVQDKDLDISGGSGLFYDKVCKVVDILEDN